MKRDKILNFIPVAVFCILLFSLSIWSLLKPDEEMSELENRYLAESPSLSKDTILDGSFGIDYEMYLSDQFVFRDKWISLKTGVEDLMGKQEINGIYLADNDYFINKYTDEDFDFENIKENIKELSIFTNEYALAMGEEHVKVMMVPTTQRILQGYLPNYVDILDEDKLIYRIKDSFVCDNMIDMTDVLEKHLDEYIYFKTDHHWTALGAYYAYIHWAETVGIEPYKLDEFTKETITEDFLGTTHAKVVYERSKDFIDIYKMNDISYTVSYETMLENANTTSNDIFIYDNLNKKDKYTVFLDGNHALVDIKTSVKNGKKLFVVKDSYAHALLPFLVNHFEQVTVVDTRYYKFGVSMFDVKKNYTDILVIHNTVEFMQSNTMYMLNF